MKKIILYIIFLLSYTFPGYAQEIINNVGYSTNDAIQQIQLTGIDDIQRLQTSNQVANNYVSIQQTGNQNKAIINQQQGLGFEMSNQSTIIQSGNLNELTLGQIGSGNVMLGFQLNYLASLITGSQKDIQTGITTNNVLTAGSSNDINGYVVEGERNKMTIMQNGNNNGVMAVQQGSDNTISAEQTGNNNYLLALQKGTNNILTGYKQENETDHVLYDRVIQIGDNLTLKSDEVSKSSVNGNTFMQTGTNLSLEINSDLINSAGGMDVKQTGKDMKVVIDQSYFSFPLK
jgi:hypothetical protein